ncbi:MAG: hypothetical protein RR942_09220 [Romboutsia sp.]
MKINKTIGLTLGLILMVSLATGCSDSGETKKTEEKSTTLNQDTSKSPVSVKDIEFVDKKILEPDSAGNRYFETKLKNNSDKTITAITVELELDNGEDGYLSTYDTIKPGETSSKIECFAPKSGKEEDMKAKKINIVVLDKDKQLYIDYDIKLDKYNVVESEVEESIDSPVLVNDIELVDKKVLEPDSIGNIYFETKFKNNSKVPVTSVIVELEIDNGEVAYLSSYDTLLPGDTSSKVECFAPKSGKEEDMKAKKISIVSLDKDKKEVYIDYDIKLNKYTVMEATQ